MEARIFERKNFQVLKIDFSFKRLTKNFMAVVISPSELELTEDLSFLSTIYSEFLERFGASDEGCASDAFFGDQFIT